jgi:3-(3-hydroxy-phenyl)propionate hydroxylase
MTPPTRGYALLRKAVLELALTEEFTRPFADPRQVQPYTYADSPLVTLGDDEFAAGPAPGATLSNCRLAEDDYLLDHLGVGFTLLYFSDGMGLSRELIALFSRLRQMDPDLTMLRIARTAGPGSGQGVLHDSSGSIGAAYDGAEGTLYLVRPDRHVAGRWKSVNRRQVAAAMQRALGEATR